MGEQETSPQGIAFSNDGTRMFIIGYSDYVYRYSLSTPFSITSSTYHSSAPLHSSYISASDIMFSNDGTKMFVSDSSTSNSLHVYSLSAPFDLTNVTFIDSWIPATSETNLSGARFSNDGKKVFIVGFTTDTIYEYSLSTPYNLTSPTLTSSIYIGSQSHTPHGIALSNDGEKLFVLASNQYKVFEYVLPTPFNLSNDTFTSLTISESNHFMLGIAFSNDGEKLFLVGTTTDTVYEYLLPAPFDIVDTDSPTWTAHSNFPTQTTVSINEPVNGTLRFTDWRFDGNVPTAVSGYSDGSTVSSARSFIFTHGSTPDQTPDVVYTGSSLTDSTSNGLFISTVTATDGILIPSILSITSNATTLGVLNIGDAITFTLTLGSIEINATVTGAYNSQFLDWSTNDNGTTYIATYTVSEGDEDQITPLQITGVTITSNQNETSIPSNGAFIAKTIDANSPKFFSAETISISQIAITINEAITPFNPVFTDFTLGGVVGGLIDSIASILNNTITLNISGATIIETDTVIITYTKITGSFEDAAGNSLKGFTERVTNTLDTTSPIITLNGTNPQIIELGDGYTELGTTTDDGSSVTINSTEFTDAIGTYHIYYDSTDASGNKAIQINRTVNVVDTTRPRFLSSELNEGTGIFTLLFDKTINVSVTNSSGFIIRDNNANLDGIRLSAPELVTTVNGTTISFRLTLDNRQSVITFETPTFDIDNNAVQDIYANQFVATTNNPITAILDTIPPIITLNGPNPQIIALGAGYTELGATTDDNSTVSTNTDQFVDALGTYFVSYFATDLSGNGAQIIRTVHVSNTIPSCTPPASGDWIVSSSCTINSSVSAQRNVIVQNNSVLTIPSGVVLDINFTTSNLTVQSGSGVLIQSGGTIT